eukprot:g46128.t1
MLHYCINPHINGTKYAVVPSRFGRSRRSFWFVDRNLPTDLTTVARTGRQPHSPSSNLHEKEHKNREKTSKLNVDLLEILSGNTEHKQQEITKTLNIRTKGYRRTLGRGSFPARLVRGWRWLIPFLTELHKRLDSERNRATPESDWILSVTLGLTEPRRRLLDDLEVRVLPALDSLLVAELGSVYPGLGATCTAQPGLHGPDRLLGSLQLAPHCPLLRVLHPSGQAKPLRLFLRVFPEENSLHFAKHFKIQRQQRTLTARRHDNRQSAP